MVEEDDAVATGANNPEPLKQEGQHSRTSASLTVT